MATPRLDRDWVENLAQMPEIESDFATGNFAPLREWLRDNIHRHGRKYDSRELLRRATGEELRVEPFLDYLRAKLVDTGQLVEPLERT